MKRILSGLLILLSIAFSCYASDVSKAKTYIDGEILFAADLNNSVDEIIIEINDLDGDNLASDIAITTSGTATLSGTFNASGTATLSGTFNASGTANFSGAANFNFEGATANDFEITFSVTDPTADRTQTIQNNSGVIPLGTAGNTLLLTTTGATNVTLPTTGTITAGLALPSGAVFFMLTGSCPSGTTDVTSTYSDKFLRINATQGSTGGSDTVTITEANLPSHTHAVGTLAAANESAHTHPPKFQSSAVAGGNSWIGIGTITSSNDGAGTTITTQGSIGAGTAHTHTLSGSTGAIGSGTAATITNPYVTCKMCQVD